MTSVANYALSRRGYVDVGKRTGLVNLCSKASVTAAAAVIFLASGYVLKLETVNQKGITEVEPRWHTWLSDGNNEYRPEIYTQLGVRRIRPENISDMFNFGGALTRSDGLRDICTEIGWRTEGAEDSPDTLLLEYQRLVTCGEAGTFPINDSRSCWMATGAAQGTPRACQKLEFGFVPPVTAPPPRPAATPFPSHSPIVDLPPASPRRPSGYPIEPNGTIDVTCKTEMLGNAETSSAWAGGKTWYLPLRDGSNIVRCDSAKEGPNNGLLVIAKSKFKGSCIADASERMFCQDGKTIIWKEFAVRRFAGDRAPTEEEVETILGNEGYEQKKYNDPVDDVVVVLKPARLVLPWKSIWLASGILLGYSATMAIISWGLRTASATRVEITPGGIAALWQSHEAKDGKCASPGRSGRIVLSGDQTGHVSVEGAATGNPKPAKEFSSIRGEAITRCGLKRKVHV